MDFFINYQVKEMYLRYFAWQFIGRGDKEEFPWYIEDLKGNLVGRTYFVSNNNTQVHKINDKNFHVLVKTKDNIKGQFTYKNGNRGIIESISKSFQNQLNKGDTLFTSFSSTIYAEGIPVAKIISIKNNPIKHELDIAVEVLADLNRLRNVFIVVE